MGVVKSWVFELGLRYFGLFQHILTYEVPSPTHLTPSCDGVVTIATPPLGQSGSE